MEAPSEGESSKQGGEFQAILSLCLPVMLTADCLLLVEMANEAKQRKKNEFTGK
jgi:hypothetical protein